MHIYQKMIFIMLDFPSFYVINWIDCNGHSKRFNETLQKHLHSSFFWTSKVSVRCRSKGDQNDFGILFHKLHAATFVLYSLHLVLTSEVFLKFFAHFKIWYDFEFRIVCSDFMDFKKKYPRDTAPGQNCIFCVLNQFKVGLTSSLFCFLHSFSVRRFFKLSR